MAAEHAMLHALLIDDALAAAPTYLRPALLDEHAAAPFGTTDAIRKRMHALRAAAEAKASELWRVLLDPAAFNEEPAALFAAVSPAERAIAARWSWRASSVEEGEAPGGETLLHAAAHAGDAALLEALLAAGARPSVAGALSNMTPLHTAAARGHADVCKLLLGAGCAVGVLTAGGRRSALDLACARGHALAARVLVEVGDADPYACGVGGSESAMALLRRLGTPAALALLAEFDVLCTHRTTDGTAKPPATTHRTAECPTGEESDALAVTDDDDGEASGSEDDEGSHKGDGDESDSDYEEGSEEEE